MKKILILLSLLVSSESFAQTNSTSGQVKATVVDSITITAGTTLNFGSFSSSSSAGTINQAGTATGGVNAVSGGETRAAGTFTVNGTGSTAYNFTLPSTATIGIGGSAGTNQMAVNLSFSSGSASRSLSSGSELVTINGTLNVAANQPVGAYTGTYTVTVNY